MLNKQSNFLLIRIKPKGRFSLTIPVPLFIIDIFVNAIQDLGWLSLLLPRNSCKSVRSIIATLGEVIYELRSYGRWSLIEVNTEEIQLSVDFY